MRRILLALALAVGACNTPSVPLPPPLELGALSFVSPGMGTVEFRGRPSPRHASSLMTAFNDSRGVGVLARTAADGSFASEPFAGTAGDTVQLWYESGGKRSDVAVCELKLGVQLDTTICH